MKDSRRRRKLVLFSRKFLQKMTLSRVRPVCKDNNPVPTLLNPICRPEHPSGLARGLRHDRSCDERVRNRPVQTRRVTGSDSDSPTTRVPGLVLIGDRRVSGTAGTDGSLRPGPDPPVQRVFRELFKVRRGRHESRTRVSAGEGQCRGGGVGSLSRPSTPPPS